MTRLTRNGGNLNGALVDLGHLEGEQLLDQRGVGARERHLGAAGGPVHLDDDRANPLAVVVGLAGHLLVERQRRLDLAQVHSDDAAFVALAVRLDDAGDDVALLAGVLPVVHLVGGLPQPLEDDLLGGLGGYAAEALGGVVPLGDDLVLVVEHRHENGGVARGAVDDHTGALIGAGRVLVGGQQRRFDRAEDCLERDIALAFQ